MSITTKELLMPSLSRRTIPTTFAIAAIGLAGAAPVALARHGADDPAGHRDRAGERHHASHTSRNDSRRDATERRHGADDGPNHR
ncbi:MAG: hypothetical protein QOF26_1684 [Baekduia sp.]|nr:hypothetical protein [Baekduia sp.]